MSGIDTVHAETHPDAAENAAPGAGTIRSGWRVSTITLAALAAGAVALVLYLATMNRTFGFMDSGEIAAVAATLGIAHPTGYPTLTMLGFLFAHLMPVRTVLALNILAALLTAAGVGVLTLLFHDLLLRLARSEPRGRPVPSERTKGTKTTKGRGVDTGRIGGNRRDDRAWQRVPTLGGSSSIPPLAAIFVASSAIWWEQAVGFEVYALHALMVPLVSLLFLRYVAEESERDAMEVDRRKPGVAGAIGFTRRGALFALMLGLAFTNHLMTIFLAPAFLVYYFWSLGLGARAWLRLAYLAPFFLLGLLPYVYLPIRASMDPLFNWGDPDTLLRFYEHVSGAMFRSMMFAGKETYAQQTAYFLGKLPSELAYAGLVLAALGVVHLAMRDRKLLVWSLLLFVVCAIYAGGYRIYDVDFYYSTAIFAVGIWCVAGLAWLHGRIGSTGALAVIALLIVVNCALHYRAVDQSGNLVNEDMALNVLESAPANALIFSNDFPFWVSGSYYLQGVEKLRPDVTVINQDYLSYTWYLHELESRCPELMRNVRADVDLYRNELEKVERNEPYDPMVLNGGFDRMVQAMANWHMARHGPVLVVSEFDRAFETPKYTPVPNYLGYRLMRDTAYLPQDFPRFRFRKWERVDASYAKICELYGRLLEYRGSYEAQHGNDSLAQRYYRYALTFDPGFGPDDGAGLTLNSAGQITATTEYFARLRRKVEGGR